MTEDFFDRLLAALSNRDGSGFAELMAEDGVYEDLAVGRVETPDSVGLFMKRTHEMSSDFTVSLVSTQRSGDSYAIEWKLTGTNDGASAALGLAATGKRFEIRGASVGQLDEDGLIKVHREYWNLSSLLVPLGATVR